jgi:hypothetical protein
MMAARKKAAKPKRPSKPAPADNTAPKQRAKPPGKPFQPGQSGNPAGRPKGSRNKLSEAFLSDFCDAWEKHGKTALAKVAKDDPANFVRAAVALIPKQVELDQNLTMYVLRDQPLSPDEWAAEYAEGPRLGAAAGTAKRPGKLPAP